MTFFKPKNLQEVYKAKASSEDITELTGRTGNSRLTDFISDKIIKCLALDIDSSNYIVDVGCGDGTLIKKISERKEFSRIKNLIGVLPNIEEVAKVHVHLREAVQQDNHIVSIHLGTSNDIPIPSNLVDIVVCNSVLHGAGQNEEDFKKSIKEIHRILKNKGKFYLGEMPDKNEIEKKNYNDSIIKWLIFSLKNNGFSIFIRDLNITIKAMITKKPFIIYPKTMFYATPVEIINKVETQGFKCLFFEKHEEIDGDLNTIISESRWNYVFEKSN